MMKVRILLLAFALLLPWSTSAQVKVTASFSILADMVAVVGGDLVTVDSIVGPDADAHVYRPSVSDARAAARADIIFINGLGFETWAGTLIESSGNDAPVVVVTKGVEPLLVDGNIDPHAWNSLPNAMIYVENIRAGLAAVDPAHAAEYAQRAAVYRTQLEALHSSTLAGLARLPTNRRTIVTVHDAFGYLAEAYGLRILAPLGIDPESKPSARELAALISQIKREGVQALFVENLNSPALINQIAKETGLSIGGRLYSDALSRHEGSAATYLAMFEQNLAQIIAGLSD